MAKYYILVIVICVAAFFGAAYYKLSPPIYIIKQYNLSYEQSSMKELNDKEVEIFDSLLQEKGINYRSAEADHIYDSLLNQKLIYSENELLKLNETEYFKKAKKDSIIIVKNSEGISFIHSIFKAKSQIDIPEKYQKYLSSNTFSVVLYFTEKDLPIDVSEHKIKEGIRYFIATEDYKNYLTLTKVNELYTAEELIDKGYLSDSTKIAIPEDILYPYIEKRFWIFPIMVLLLLFPMYSTIKPKEDKVNLNRLSEMEEVLERQVTTAKIWLSLGIFCFVAACAVIFFEMNISEGGGAIFFIGNFLALASIIVFFYYRKRAKQLSQILTGEGVLAKWEYDAFFWQNYVDNILQKFQKMNKSTLLMVSIIIIIVFGFIMIADPKAAKTMGLIGLGLIALITIVANIVPIISAKNLAKSSPIVIIGQNCVLLGKQFHSWGMFGNRFESAMISEDEINMLEVKYSYRTKHGRSTVTVFVPIPKGKMEEAQEIAKRLMEGKK
ncbi:MAG: hypothetical protein N3A67_04940 [Ignavibacteria bacterium]|nr:hypothetical protein [Ignavibacteria bacterium]